MTNTLNQILSNDTDIAIQENSNYFFLPIGCTLAELKHNQIFFKKENRGE